VYGHSYVIVVGVVFVCMGNYFMIDLIRDFIEYNQDQSIGVTHEKAGNYGDNDISHTRARWLTPTKTKNPSLDCFSSVEVVTTAIIRG
jgi:hypothetical protein